MNTDGTVLSDRLDLSDRRDLSDECDPSDRCEQPMEPQSLRRQLEARGLELLGVNRHHASREVLVVYLHGNAGQWRHGTAQHEIATVPGVVSVTESPQSAAILLVEVDPAA